LKNAAVKRPLRYLKVRKIKNDPQAIEDLRGKKNEAEGEE